MAAVRVVDSMAQVLKKSYPPKLLAGLCALPHFNVLQKSQASRLEALMGKVSMNLDMAGRVLESLDPEIWTPEILESLKGLIAGQTSDGTQISQRAKQQDYRSLVRLLPGQWWQILESRQNGVEKLTKLVHLAGKLGLRNPTEGTNGSLVVLSFYSEAADPWTEAEKQSL